MPESRCEGLETLDQEVRRLCRNGAFADAIAPARSAHELTCRHYGPDDPAALEWLELLGRLSHAAGDYQRAYTLYLEAEERSAVAAGAEAPLHLTCLSGLARACQELGDFGGALQRQKALLELRERSLDPEHPDCALSLHSMANIYEESHDFAQAEAHYRRAIELLQRVKGAADPDTLTCANNLGVLLEKLARYEESEEILGTNLARRREVLGDRHPDLVQSLTNLGGLRHAQGRLEEATALNEEALELARALHGPRSGETARQLYSLGVVELERGRHTSAAEFLRAAYEIHSELGTDRSPSAARCLWHLSDVHEALGELTEARRLAEDAVGILRSALGDSDLTTASALDSLGSLCRRQEQYPEAEALLRRALDVRRSLLPPGHPEVAQSLNNLAVLRQDTGDSAGAEPLFLEALEYYRNCHGATHPSLLPVLGNLSLVNACLERIEPACDYWRQQLIVGARCHALPLPPTAELIVTIRERGSQFEACITLPQWDGASSPFCTFTPPFGSEFLEELRWYLEDYPQQPTPPDHARAKTVAELLQAAGKCLFRGLFNDYAATRLWALFKHLRDVPRALTIDATAPGVLRLPWELLADNDASLVSQGIEIRRRIRATSTSGRQPSPPDDPLRVLMVVPRHPDAFLDPQASSAALLDATEQLGRESLAVEFLYPPTLQALRARLAAQDRHVQVVHFDGHGEYRQETGCGYLHFEHADGSLHLVPASEFAALLREGHVALAILDACESARADGPDPLGSVGLAVAESGVQGVLAMQFRVLAHATRCFFRAFYRELLAGRSLSHATQLARMALYEAPERQVRSLRNETVPVADWFVPALYLRGEGPTLLEGSLPPEVASAHREAACFGFPTCAPLLSRDAELWRLERLLREHRVVVLHGMRGQGKTTLAVEAARWLTHIGLVRQAVYVDFDGGGGDHWGVEQTGGLLGTDLSAFSWQERRAALEETLAGSGTLVVWDSVEAVPVVSTREGDSGELVDLLTHLRGGHPARVVTTYDSRDALLQMADRLTRDGTNRVLIVTCDPYVVSRVSRVCPGAATLPLAGLPRSATREFLYATAPDAPSVEAVLPLSGHLHGYAGGSPAILKVLLNLLPGAGYDVFEAVRRYEERCDGPDTLFTAAGVAGGTALTRALRRVEPYVLDSLPVLAAFAGRCLSFMPPLVGNISPGDWPSLRERCLGGLAESGLLRPEPCGTLPGWYVWSFILGRELGDHELGLFGKPVDVSVYHFHPALSPYLRHRLGDAERQEQEQRAVACYSALGAFLEGDVGTHPELAMGLGTEELPNFARCVDLALGSGEPASAATIVSRMAPILHRDGRREEYRALLRRARAVMCDQSSSESGVWSQGQVAIEGLWGEELLAGGETESAERVFLGLLERLDPATADCEVVLERVRTLSHLGRIHRQRGRHLHAEAALHEAARLVASAGLPADVQSHHRGSLALNLADCLIEQRRYEEAEAQHGVAEQAFAARGDSASLIGLAADRGDLCLVRGNPGGAREYYEEHLNLAEEAGDVPAQAYAFHQLGVCAHEEAERASRHGNATKYFDEAEASYRRCLSLRQSIPDHDGVAAVANQLGLLKECCGRFVEAEHWLRYAISLDRQLGNGHNVAKGLSNLARLLWRVVTDRAPDESPSVDSALLEEADSLLQEALGLTDEADADQRATCFLNLTRVAEARGDLKAAGRWRHEMRRAYAASPTQRAAEPFDERLALVLDTAATVPIDPEAPRVLELCLRTLELGGYMVLSSSGLPAAFRRAMCGDADPEALGDEYDLSGEDYVFLLRFCEALARSPDQAREHLRHKQ
jgi:tetratricopeptide (TPR) repeat protein